MKKIFKIIIFSMLSLLSYSRIYSTSEYFEQYKYKDNDYIVYLGLWCPSCRAEMKHLDEIYKKYNQVENLHIIIDGKDSKESIQKYFDSKGYDFPVIYDENRKYMHALSTEYIPAIYKIFEKEEKLYYTQIDIEGISLNYYEKNIIKIK